MCVDTVGPQHPVRVEVPYVVKRTEKTEEAGRRYHSRHNEPISSPSAMGRVNADGASVSRRQHLAAQKKEKEKLRNEQLDNENKEARRQALQTSRESLETMKASLAVLAKASTHVETIGANLQRMVEQADHKAAKEALDRRITALEKKIMLGIGNVGEIRIQLGALLDEQF